MFVAPHYDDVALSCGGQVAMAARHSEPLIVTVFAGEPRDALGDFAHFQHDRWGFDDDVAVVARRAEDACSARALGASVRTLWLDELDAIYRNPAYDSDAALFGRLLASDEPLIVRIVDALVELPAHDWFVPLGAANHVDHQLVFRVGQALAALGHTVWAYADLPYALDEVLVQRRLALGGVGERRVALLDEEAWARKIVAIACYMSQLPVLFRERGEPSAALAEQARRVGGGAPAEALWRVMSGDDPWRGSAA